VHDRRPRRPAVLEALMELEREKDEAAENGSH
jgi:hypothetical protein